MVALCALHVAEGRAQTCTEWSTWQRVTSQLDFSFQACEQTASRVEILWRWSNLSADSVEFSYWIHLRDPAGCIDMVRGALTTGTHVLPGGTVQDLDRRASIRNTQFEGVFVCVGFPGQAGPTRESLVPGMRVRLTTSIPAGDEIVGVLTAQESDRIALTGTPGSDSVVTVTLDRVAELAVSRGMEGAGGVGLGIGVAVGAIAGALIGKNTNTDGCYNLLQEPRRRSDGFILSVVDYERFTRIIQSCSMSTDQQKTERMGTFATIGMVMGSAVGMFIGSRIRRERWQGVRLSLVPVSDDQVGVSLAVSF